MSFRVVNEVLEHSDVEHTERLVLIALAEAAHHDGVTWIPQGPRDDRKSIAFRARASVRAVERAVASLQEQIELEVRKAQRRQKRVNVYRVLTGALTFIEVDYDRLPFELDRPFSTAAEIIDRREAARHLGGPSGPARPAILAVGHEEDGPTDPVVAARQSGGDDPPIQAGPSSYRDPSLDPSGEPSETSALPKNHERAEVPAAAGGKQESLADQLLRVFAEELGTWPKDRGEWGAWKRSFKELAEREEPSVDEFRLVARAYVARLRDLNRDPLNDAMSLEQSAFGLQTAWLRISATLQGSYFALYRWTTDTSWRLSDHAEVEWILEHAPRLDEVQRAELLALARRVADAHTDAGSAVLTWVENTGWAIEDEQTWTRELTARTPAGTKAPSIRAAANERRLEIRRDLAQLKFGIQRDVA